MLPAAEEMYTITVQLYFMCCLLLREQVVGAPAGQDASVAGM